MGVSLKPRCLAVQAALARCSERSGVIARGVSHGLGPAELRARTWGLLQRPGVGFIPRRVL